MPTDTDRRWVYSFDDAPADDKALLGGKGAGLAAMTAAGLPVPPGFTITTEACVAYQDAGHHVPDGLWDQTEAALAEVEAAAGRRFGDADDPLLLSVRSGAAVSMPGMMDTVLNLGLNDETAAALAAQTGDERFAYDAYRRFVAMFGEIVMGVEADRFERIVQRAKGQTEGGQDTDLSVDQLREIVAQSKRVIAGQTRQRFPDDPREQLRQAVAAVFDSWDNDRAVHYRRVHNIQDDIGTGVTVQAMVFGNKGWDSGTGVAFTRDPSTGAKGLYGEYLLNAQGEDVVAGIRTPKPIAEMAGDLPETFDQFQALADQLEQTYGDVQDIEFTIEQGTLWLLQTRTAKRSGAAAVRIAVEMVAEGVIDERTAVGARRPRRAGGPPPPGRRRRRRGRAPRGGPPGQPGCRAGPRGLHLRRRRGPRRRGRARRPRPPADVAGGLPRDGRRRRRGHGRGRDDEPRRRRRARDGHAVRGRRQLPPPRRRAGPPRGRRPHGPRRRLGHGRRRDRPRPPRAGPDEGPRARRRLPHAYGLGRRRPPPRRPRQRRHGRRRGDGP